MSKLNVQNDNGNTTLAFDKDFLDEALKGAVEYRNDKLEESGLDPEKNADEFSREYQLDFEAEIEEIEISDIDGGCLKVTMHTPYNEVYLNLYIPLGAAQLEQMTDLVIKKLNQAKAAMQALKK